MKNQINWNQKRHASEFVPTHGGFNEILEKHLLRKKHLGKIRRLYSGILGIVIVGITTFYIYNSDKKNESVIISELKITEPTAKIILPIEIPSKTKVVLPVEKRRNVSSIETKKSTEKKNENAPLNQKLTVFTKAEPLNGYNHFNDYLSSAVDSLLTSYDSILNTKVTAHFEINEKGLPQNVGINNLEDTLITNQLVKIIMNMPKWQPATANQKPITCKFAIPITLQFEKKIIKN